MPTEKVSVGNNFFYIHFACDMDKIPSAKNLFPSCGS